VKRVSEERVTISRERHNGQDFVRLINSETGQLLIEYYDGPRKKGKQRPPKGRTPEFFRVYRTNWLDIIRKKKLTVHEGGFLMFLMGFIGWESSFLVHPDTGENLTASSLAKVLGMDRGNVSDLLHRLNRQGFVFIVNRGEGRENHIMFNINVAFFGKYLKDIREQKAFTDVAYQPALPIKYEEPPKNGKQEGDQ
jgi:hypothetical protein